MEHLGSRHGSFAIQEAVGWLRPKWSLIYWASREEIEADYLFEEGTFPWRLISEDNYFGEREQVTKTNVP